MSAIRPFEPRDLEGVARLYERVMRSGSRDPPPWLPTYFERTLLDHPWYDPELPSLVYANREGGIVGFLGAHVRRLVLRGRPIRMVCSGQLVADPDAGAAGVGGLLLRRCLAGPQELTITDGATEQVRALWQRLGGRTLDVASIAWTRPLRPVRLAVEVRGRRAGSGSGRRSGGGASASSPLEAVAARLPARLRLRPPEPDSVAEPLTPAALAELPRRLDAGLALRPDYDEAFLRWLYGELDAVPSRGARAARLVRRRDGEPLGWYVALLKPGGISQALSLASFGGGLGAVLDQLVWEADRAGSVALQGRVEPTLLPHLRGRRCLLHRAEWALVHSGDPALLAEIALGGALLTRLDGEWWMGHHLP